MNQQPSEPSPSVDPEATIDAVLEQLKEIGVTSPRPRWTESNAVAPIGAGWIGLQGALATVQAERRQVEAFQEASKQTAWLTRVLIAATIANLVVTSIITVIALFVLEPTIVIETG